MVYNFITFSFAVFPNVPAAPGMLCDGEDRKFQVTLFQIILLLIELTNFYYFWIFLGSIYRRGARRWRKLYRVNGHIFQAKRFNRVSYSKTSLNYSNSITI